MLCNVPFVLGISRLQEDPGNLFFNGTEAGCSLQLWQTPRSCLTCMWPADELQLFDNIRRSRCSKAQSGHLWPGTAEVRCTGRQRSSCRGPLCEWLPRFSVCGYPRAPVRPKQQAWTTWSSSRASTQLPGGAAVMASAAHGLKPDRQGLKCLTVVQSQILSQGCRNVYSTTELLFV